MRYAIFTVSCPDFTPEEALDILSKLGYEGIEWRVVDQKPSPEGTIGFWQGNRCTWPLNSFLDDAPRIRAITEKAGMVIPNIGTYVGCDDLPGVERAMQATVKVGAPQLRITVPGYDGKSSYLKIVDRAIGQYRDVEALAKKSSLRAMIEIHMGNIVPSASAAAAFARHFDPKYVGIIHDAGNMVYEGYENYRLGCEVLGPYLGYVHVKSAAWKPVAVRPDGSAEWRCDSSPITKGTVDMTALLRALKSVGYDGWLSFEDFSTDEPLSVRVRENIAYLKKVAAQVASE
ncbi:MAG TPA: sugar phosphate isomerase/epimerase family protein [Planctomycetota bacterium]|jgi:sugar phosphate isomerase/epimerase